MRRPVLAVTGAAIALLALLAGPPLALITLVGNPVPDWATLTSGTLDEPTVLRLLTCLAWIAWAQFTIGALVEATAAIGGRGLPPRITIGQGLARVLITAIVTTSTLAPLLTSAPATANPLPRESPQVIATAASGPHAMPLDAPSGSGARAPSEQRRSHTTPVGTVGYVVGSDPRIGPTLWSIADHTLGDPLRWREIWQLNQHRTMSDGRTFTSPDEIHDGWTLQLPPDAHVTPTRSDSTPAGSHVEVVEPGDTLSAIAQRAYGNPDDYPLIAAANRGRPEPDGRVFTDPNHIWPGWRLSIPARTELGPANGHPSTPAPPTPTPSKSTMPPPAPSPTTTETNTPSTPATPRGSVDAPTESATPSPAAPSATPATANAPGTKRDEHRAAGGSNLDLPVLASAGSAVLAALTVTVLARRRRRQLRHRRPGHSIPTAPPAQRAAERRLIASTGSGAPDAGLLHDALRALAAVVASTPNGRLPDVIAARLSADELDLTVTDADIPRPDPWTRGESERSWRLHRDQLTTPPPTASDQFAPYPTLTTVATTVYGHACLLDLEHAGTLAVTGLAEARRALLRYLAAELAHNSWSEHLHVSLYGIGEDLAPLDPTRISHHRDLPALLRILRAQLDDTATDAQTTGHDPLTARLHPDIGDIATPHVVLLDLDTVPDEDQATLDTLLSDLTDHPGRTGIAVVIAGDHPPATVAGHLQIAPDNTVAVTIPPFDPTPAPLYACGIPREEAADLAALLALADDLTDRPTPAARGDAPWDRYADAAGAPRREHSIDRQLAGQDPHPSTAHPVGPPSPPTPFSSSPTGCTSRGPRTPPTICVNSPPPSRRPPPPPFSRLTRTWTATSLPGTTRTATRRSCGCSAHPP
jgi:hypothetical protein